MKFTAAVVFLVIMLALPSAGAAERAYFPGEELVYRITALRFLSAGSAVFSVEEEAGEHGRPFYRLKVSANSSFPFSAFYRVRNSMEARLDPDTLLPVSFEKKRREASFRRSFSIEFDRERGLALPGDGGEAFSVPPEIRDYLSLFYHIRSVDLPLGESAVFAAAGGRKAYDVGLEALRKETVFRGGGEVGVTVYRVSVSGFEAEGILGDDSREAFVWITDDGKRLPLRIEIEASFGGVVMVLTKHTEGRRGNEL